MTSGSHPPARGAGRPVALALVGILALLPGARAEEPKAPPKPVALTWKWSPGLVVKLITARRASGTLLDKSFHAGTALTATLTVKEIDVAGSAVIAMAVNELRVDIERPDKSRFQYISRPSTGRPLSGDLLEEGYSFIIDQPLILRMAPTGEASLDVNPDGAPTGAQVHDALQDILDLLAGSLAFLPDRPLGPKAVWRKNRTTPTHNAAPWYAAILLEWDQYELGNTGQGEDPVVQIKVQPDVNLDGVVADLRSKVNQARALAAAKAAASGVVSTKQADDAGGEMSAPAGGWMYERDADSQGGATATGPGSASRPTARGWIFGGKQPPGGGPGAAPPPGQSPSAPKATPSPRLMWSGSGTIAFRSGSGLLESLRQRYDGAVTYLGGSATVSVTRQAKMTVLQKPAPAPAAAAASGGPSGPPPPAAVPAPKPATPAEELTDAPLVPEGECPFGEVFAFERVPKLEGVKAEEGKEFIVVEFQSRSGGRARYDLKDFVLVDPEGTSFICSGIVVTGTGIVSDGKPSAGKSRLLAWSVPVGKSYLLRFKDRGLILLD